MKEGERVVVLAYVKKDDGGNMVEVESRWSQTTAWVSRKDVEHRRRLILTGMSDEIEKWAIENKDAVKTAILKLYWDAYEKHLDSKTEEEKAC